MTSGSFWFFYMFDICEAIDLDALRRTLGIVPGARDPGTIRRTRPEWR